MGLMMLKYYPLNKWVNRTPQSVVVSLYHALLRRLPKRYASKQMKPVTAKFATIVLTSIVVLGCATAPTVTNSVTYSDSRPTELWREALVVDILSKTPELYSHRMNGEVGNEVYYKDDGTEVVVDPNGNMVTSPENQGSFNYYHPEKRPLAHYMADIKPWIEFGNHPNDKTSKSQRLDAYSRDLAIGITAALEERSVPKEIESFSYSSPEELKLARQWVAIFSSSSEISIFDLYERRESISYEQAVAMAKNLIGDLP